jgi:hypothetical protein
MRYMLVTTGIGLDPGRISLATNHEPTIVVRTP